MSKRDSVKKPLVAPADVDEAFLKRLDYEDPFHKASIWMHKLMLHRIHDMDDVAAHYENGDYSFSNDEHPISQLFSQEDGRFCDRFRYYCRMIAQYEQGQVPKALMEIDYRVFDILIKRLKRHADRMDSIRLAQREVAALYRLATQRDKDFSDKEKFEARIAELQKSIVSIFGKISDDFYAQEHAHAKPPRATPATKDDVEEIVAPLKVKQDAALVSIAETRKIVKRMDNREKNALHRKKLQYTRDRLNAIHAQWLVAKQDPNVISISSHKADYDAALKYYKKEFNALGVYTRVDLKKALKAWSWHTSNFRTTPGTLPSNSQSVKSV